MADDDARPIPRRRVLRAAVAGSALALVAGAVGLVRSRGYDVPDEVDARLVVLAPASWVVVRAAARRICAGDAPGVLTADEADVAGFVDAYLSRVPPKIRRDFVRFLGFLEQIAPATVGFASRFSRLAAAEQDTVLAALESNASDLLRGGFEGLKALVFMGYYRDARTWTILGYDGPLVGRR